MFHSQPTLKTYVRNAIERSIQEWINPVVERSVKIAVITTENIVKKVSWHFVCLFILIIFCIVFGECECDNKKKLFKSWYYLTCIQCVLYNNVLCLIGI